MVALIRQWASYKSFLTRIKKFLNKNHADPNIVMAEYTTRLELLKEIFAQYLELQDKIEELDDRKESDRDEIEDKFYSVISRLTHVIDFKTKQAVIYI